MIKTKEVFAYEERVEPNRKRIDLDEAINEFLSQEEIDSTRLVDIKYGNVGYFHEGGGEGEIESSALIIYKTN